MNYSLKNSKFPSTQLMQPSTVKKQSNKPETLWQMIPCFMETQLCPQIH